MNVGNGILVDFCLYGGTNSHDKKSGTIVYVHWQTARDYLMPDEVIVQLWVSESSKLSGGQWGRYCSTCPAGFRNEKVSIAGVHIPAALFALGQPDPSLRPTPRTIITPFATTVPFKKYVEATVSWAYSGKECAENKQSHEGGYLPLSLGEHLKILSTAEVGHTTNSFPFYVYCENENGSRGWTPQILLHRDGYGSFGVLSGLTRRTELNGTLVRVSGRRDDGRVMGTTKDKRQIAIPIGNVHLLDFNEDVEKILQKGNRALKYAHPDKFGSNEAFVLLRIILDFA